MCRSRGWDPAYVVVGAEDPSIHVILLVRIYGVLRQRSAMRRLDCSDGASRG